MKIAFAFKIGLSCLLFSSIGSYVPLSAQTPSSPLELSLMAASRNKWTLNQHDLVHDFTNTSDRIFYSNFNQVDNLYLRLQGRYAQWLFELGYAAEDYFTSFRIDAAELEGGRIQARRQSESTLGLDLMLGREWKLGQLWKRSLDLQLKIGYSLMFSEGEVNSFEGYTNFRDEESGDLLYSIFSHDKVGEQSHLAPVYSFAQAGIYVRYALSQRLFLQLGAGGVLGFQDIGRTKVEFNPGTGTLLLSETSTQGTALFVEAGLGIKMGKDASKASIIPQNK